MFKINNLKTIAILILSIVVLASCSKDSPVTPSKSTAEMLFGSWKLDSAASSDLNFKLPEGMLSIKFDSNYNYQMYQDNNTYKSGKWKIYYNEILFYSTTSSKTLTSFISLNDQEMRLNYQDGPYAFAEYYTKIK